MQNRKYFVMQKKQKPAEKETLWDVLKPLELAKKQSRKIPAKKAPMQGACGC
jgi:hypothetical protein